MATRKDAAKTPAKTAKDKADAKTGKSAKTAKGAKKSPEPHAAAAAERLTQKLQTRVEIDRRGKGGTIRIHFHSEEELIRLYERITEPTGPRDQPEN